MEKRYLILTRNIRDFEFEDKIKNEYLSIANNPMPFNIMKEDEDNMDVISSYYKGANRHRFVDSKTLVTDLYALSICKDTVNNIKMFKHIISLLIKRNRQTLIKAFREIVNNNANKEILKIIKHYSSILSVYYAINGKMLSSMSFYSIYNKENVSLYDSLFTKKKIDLEDDNIGNFFHIANIYNNIVVEVQDKEINENLVSLSDKYINATDEINERTNDTYLTLLFFNYAIVNIVALSNLYYASIDNKKTEILVDYSLVDKIIFESRNKTIKRMTGLLSKPNVSSNLFYDFSNYYDALNIADEIIKILKIDRINHEIAYYTKINSLMCMFPQKNINDNEYNFDKIGKFSLMHYAYMNDPTEGKMLMKQFSDKEENINNLHYPFVCMKCFTSRIDDIPMWEMYGDKAKGCCIILDWNAMFMEFGRNIPLYNVCYLDDEGKAFTFNHSAGIILPNEDINSCIKELKKINNKIKSDSINKSIFLDMLSEIMFLFKSREFEYEEEIRLLYFDDDLEIEYTTDSIPKLFLLTDFEIYIKKIILGPRNVDNSNLIPYLQDQLSLMNKQIGYEYETEILKSKVNYK